MSTGGVGGCSPLWRQARLCRTEDLLQGRDRLRFVHCNSTFDIGVASRRWTSDTRASALILRCGGLPLTPSARGNCLPALTFPLLSDPTFIYRSVTAICGDESLNRSSFCFFSVERGRAAGERHLVAGDTSAPRRMRCHDLHSTLRRPGAASRHRGDNCLSSSEWHGPPFHCHCFCFDDRPSILTYGNSTSIANIIPNSAALSQPTAALRHLAGIREPGILIYQITEPPPSTAQAQILNLGSSWPEMNSASRLGWALRIAAAAARRIACSKSRLVRERQRRA